MLKIPFRSKDKDKDKEKEKEKDQAYSSHGASTSHASLSLSTSSSSTSKFSKTERETMTNVFNFLVNDCPDPLLKMAKLVHSEELNELSSVLVDFSLANGNTFPMLRLFVEDEFIRNSREDPGSIMRGNCIASKIVKEYLNKIGRNYLQELLGASLAQICADKSMEIDELRLDNPQDIEQNKNLLLDRVRSIVQHIMSKDMINCMPPQLKLIANIFAEFAHKYAPEQFHALVGGFLLLRYVNPALSNPDVYDLVPSENVSITTRRNLVLITKIIQNLSNGLEFGNKEPFMMCMNDYIKANRWKMEQYFQNIVSQSQTASVAAWKGVADSHAISERDLAYFNKIISGQQDKIVQMVENASLRQQLLTMMEPLSQFRHIDNFTDKKDLTDAHLAVRLTVESGGKIFELSIDGTEESLHPLVLNIVSQMKKHQSKNKVIHTIRSKPTDPKVFGKPLEQVMEMQAYTRPDLNIPEVMHESMAVVISKGMGVQGIFRTSPEKSSVDAMKVEIDKGVRIDYATKDYVTLSNLIKVYLRELPDCLLTEKLYQSFLDSGNSFREGEREMQLSRVKQLIHVLPRSNRDLLEALIKTLWMIDQNSSVNLMTASNLAVCFGPCILTSRNVPPDTLLKQADMANRAVQFLIDEYQTLFKESIDKFEHQQKLPFIKVKKVAHPKSIQCGVRLRSNVVCTASSNIMRFWDTEKIRMIKELDNGASFGHVLAVIAQDENLFWTTTAGVIQQWNFETGKIVRTIKFPSSTMTLVNNQLWANSLDRPNITLFNTADGFIIKLIDTPDMMMHVQYLPGCNQVWCSSGNGKIFVYDPKTGYLLKEIAGVHSRKISSLLECKDHIWSAGDDGSICVWSGYELVKKIEIHSGKVKSLNSFQGVVWCCTWNFSIVLLNSERFEKIAELKEHTDAVSGVLFIEAGNGWTAWSFSYDGFINVWKIPSTRY
eukprot:TRINITY_DN4052_c0_g1_i3.p1 TRINITY_DN4052_c0_g1~~TRINITY_DN4052_c0_g1_i3.p1  ORF type:complete len:946 (+),score=210.27 TRINITY_DN4052_c0_g1_i3:187-3024(+)